MRLVELKGELLTYAEDELKYARYTHVNTVDEAHGVRFKCPRCTLQHGVHAAHPVVVWFKGQVPDRVRPELRLVPLGRVLDDLTLATDEGQPAELVWPCGWHGAIQGGEASSG